MLSFISCPCGGCTVASKTQKRVREATAVVFRADSFKEAKFILAAQPGGLIQVRRRSREDICSKGCSPSKGCWKGKVFMMMSIRACAGQRRSEGEPGRPGGGDWTGALHTTSPVLSLTHPLTPPLSRQTWSPGSRLPSGGEAEF